MNNAEQAIANIESRFFRTEHDVGAHHGTTLMIWNALRQQLNMGPLELPMWCDNCENYHIGHCTTLPKKVQETLQLAKKLSESVIAMMDSPITSEDFEQARKVAMDPHLDSLIGDEKKLANCRATAGQLSNRLQKLDLDP